MKNMLKQYLIFIVVVAQYFQEISTKSVLATTHTFYVPHVKCSLKDRECLKTQLQKSVNILSEGIPELGVENIAKMSIDSISIKKDGLILELSNVTVDGLKNANIDQIWIDMYLKYIHITFHTTLNFDCDYKADGNLISLPVHGEGKAHIVKKNVIMEMVLLFDINKNENGKDIINLKTYRYGFEIQNGTIYRFENSYNGDKAKSDIAHELINRNWRTMSNGFGRFLFDKINDKIFNAVKIYLKSIPLEAIAAY